MGAEWKAGKANGAWDMIGAGRAWAIGAEMKGAECTAGRAIGAECTAGKAIGAEWSSGAAAKIPRLSLVLICSSAGAPATAATTIARTIWIKTKEDYGHDIARR